MFKVLCWIIKRWMETLPSLILVRSACMSTGKEMTDTGDVLKTQLMSAEITEMILTCSFCRLFPETMQQQDINVQKSSSSRFSFPRLPEDVVSPDEPVDVRVRDRNIYSELEASNQSLKFFIKLCLVLFKSFFSGSAWIWPDMKIVTSYLVWFC